MWPAIIRKSARDWTVPPHWNGTEAEAGAFSPEAAMAALRGSPGGGLNLGWATVDRQVVAGRGARVALRFLAADGARRELSYAELSQDSNRFAQVLSRLGLAPGERVFLLTGRIPELYLAVLGALKFGAVVSPLFSAFGPEPIATRVRLGEGRVLVTSEALYRRKLQSLRTEMPSLRQVLLTDVGSEACPPGTQALAPLLAEADRAFPVAPTRAETPALLHFTSGTTGTPKGALHVHGAALTHYLTGLTALDLHTEDIYWCTADPGWVTGMSYGILAPLLLGVTSVVDEAEFDAERWYRILQDEAVSVWYTAPTAIRMLMKAGPELARRHRFPGLRFVASVGEPLNPEAVWWGKEVLGLPIHDNWWQTETGGIMLANTPALDIKPGSMGKPLPGVHAAIVHRRADGRLERIEAADVEGELALEPGWPSMFRDYLGESERYRSCFVDGLYLSGDLVRRDRDGYYWFVGRSDDVIKSAGHLIGPFEVESVLLEHPAVAEAAVIGKPDPLVGEVVKAFISLKNGYTPDADLVMSVSAHARKRLGPAVAPKEIAILAQLPRTRSGKLMRRLLKARDLGLPEGDTSTVEGGWS